MLSPHEIATLMLVKNAPDQFDAEPTDINALLERQLVTLDKHVSGQYRLRLTDRGQILLRAVRRSR